MKSQAKTPLSAIRRIGIGMIICSLPLTPGCQDSPAGTIAGKVTLDGKPLTSGRVMAANANGNTGTAIIQTDGSYELAKRSGIGLDPGDYDLWVIAYEGGQMIDPEASAKLAIPAKYTEQGTAGFSATVVAGKVIPLDLELKSD